MGVVLSASTNAIASTPATVVAATRSFRPAACFFHAAGRKLRVAATTVAGVLAMAFVLADKTTPTPLGPL